MSLTSELRLADASALDFAEVLDDLGRPQVVRRRYLAQMAVQIAGGAAMTIRDRDGALCLVAGLWPEDGYAEAWFGAGPALKAHLRPVLRLVDRALRIVTLEAQVSEVRCFIHPQSVAGARLAALCGFEALGETDHPLGAVLAYVRRFQP